MKKIQTVVTEVWKLSGNADNSENSGNDLIYISLFLCKKTITSKFVSYALKYTLFSGIPLSLNVI